jgi:low temperature requirement protein LtrA
MRRSIGTVTVNDADGATPASSDDHPPGSAPLVGFLELFYDLVFVAATMVLSNAFSVRVSWGWALTCALMFTMLWLLWFNTTTLMNVERVDDFSHRALILVQMLLITLTVLAFADKDTSSNDYLGVTYGLALAVVALMHHRAARGNPECAGWARVRRNRLLLAAAVGVSTTFLPDWADDVAFLFVILLLIVPAAFGTRRRRPMPPVNTHHMLERAALLTLIMCGEAFVKVSLVVSSGTIELSDLLAIVVEFVAVFAIFFMYFDDVPKAGIRPGMARAELWALAHLPLQIGIVTVAIGISKYLQIGDEPIETKVIVILTFGFVLVYGGLALVGLLGERTPIGPLTVARLVTAAVVVAFGVATWGFGWLTPGGMLLCLAGLAIVHVAVTRWLRTSTTAPALH